MRRWSNVGLVLAQRLRRWPNVGPTSHVCWDNYVTCVKPQTPENDSRPFIYNNRNKKSDLVIIIVLSLLRDSLITWERNNYISVTFSMLDMGHRMCRILLYQRFLFTFKYK